MTERHLGLQASRLDGFHCAAAEVRHSYKHKHMRTAFAQLPHFKDASSSVSSKASDPLSYSPSAAHRFSLVMLARRPSSVLEPETAIESVSGSWLLDGPVALQI